MFQALANLQGMRTAKGGGPVNLTQTRRLEASFRRQFDLTSTQFKYLTDLYDRGKAGDVFAAFQTSRRRPSVAGATPPACGRRRFFASDTKECHGELLQVSFRKATVYDRNECFETINVVKACRGCGTRYHFDKRVVPGDLSGNACHWHIFDPWADGKLPLYIASKSGKVTISTAYLTDVAIIQCKTRCA